MTLPSRLLILTLSCLSWQASAWEPQQCAASLEGLKNLAGDPAFPLRWEEVSMSDGKPLAVAITERDGTLFLEFVKTREGLWAEGAAVICRGSTGLEARIGHIHMGPAAHWILRQSAGQARSFAMSREGTGPLHISTLGWKGVFSPK